MFYRKDAEKAKAAMEEARNGDLQLRVCHLALVIYLYYLNYFLFFLQKK